MKRQLGFGLLCTLFISSAVYAASTYKGFQTQFPILAVEPERYWKNEIPANALQQGWTLCGKDDNSSRLAPGKADLIQQGAQTDLNLTAPAVIQGCDTAAGEKPWFYFYDPSKLLTSGRIITLSAPHMVVYEKWVSQVSHDEAFVSTESPVKQYQLGDKAYQIILRQPSKTQYNITLKLNKQTQTFITRQESTELEAYASFTWVGDLDQDGKLDLVAEFMDSPKTSASVLYLSSKAKPGQLLAPVAKYVEPLQ